MSDLSEDPYLVAKGRGLEVVLPGARELQLDIDDEPSYVVLQQMMKVLEDNGLPVNITRETVSAGGNKHVYLDFFGVTELDVMSRIALQACLGSDRKRELLSALRSLLCINERPPTCLFERPAQETL
jgi:hypothetical protein